MSLIFLRDEFEELKGIEENIEKVDFVNLRETCTSDAEIIEAPGVMEMFTSFNKIPDSLQINIDFKLCL